MTTPEKSVSKKKRPLRKLVFLGVLAGVAVAIKNALDNKGGSYEAPAPPAPGPSAPRAPEPAQHSTTSSVPSGSGSHSADEPVKTSPIVTAEEIVGSRPVENLDEFADPAAATEGAPDAEPDEAAEGTR